ncbi:hypothetical protein [Hymenobacter sp. YC55]|uniref:hypothetical protein n=1 Tax=Hymenobacter sp. YC55 TaxID=3034019 RepID=UPI0023F6BE27|nr:hypothetical protein [Hymenobacter sp. YC55]MDF7813487.1 hypothetical protein [Hymenobacter sp. YC55]
MKKNIIRFVTLLLLSIGTFSCEKDYGNKLGPLEDSVADIPVTVSNAAYFERVPIITTSVAAGGRFDITLQIPAGKGNIREITRVATGTTLANLNSSAPFSLNFNTTTQTASPIVGNGSNEITFSTSLAAYSAYRTRLATVPNYSAGVNSAGPAATVAMLGTAPNQVVDERTPTILRYWFLITLEDGTEIVTTEVRVRILP